MQISPRYDADPIISIDGPVDDQCEPVTRQRRRLQETLGRFTDEQWRTPSRCEGWTNQDVIAHLVGTNQFWTMSLRAGRAGTPTRYLAGFDPRATPAEMVAGMTSLAPEETLARFAATNDELLAVVAELDDDGWATLAEAPPGHLSARAVAHHALWDAWVHERDVLVPVGVTPEDEPDEVVSCLRYAAALAPALALTTGRPPTGTFAIEARDPDVSVILEVGDAVRVGEGTAPTGSAVLRGRASDLVEALSIRTPLDAEVPDVWRELLGGLAAAFDAELP